MSTFLHFPDRRRPAYLLPASLLTAILLLSGFRHRSEQKTKDTSGTHLRYPIGRLTPAGNSAKAGNTALIELFTSEGCSSCPAADELLPAFRQSNIFVLEFHVDYWDRLGWKDPFSDASFSTRQRDYAQRFRLSSIYTPQVVINGSAECVGSDRQAIRRIIDRAITDSTGTNDAGLQLSASGSGNEITVSYTVSGERWKEKSKTAVVCLALVQREAVSRIGAGENGGRTLKHINIVRDLKMSSMNSGTETFSLPVLLKPGQVSITGWVQESESGPVITVASAQRKP